MAQKPPTQGRNILFIFTDQQHAFALGCMGTPDISTPAIDKMAEEGVVFSNCYSVAPVCTPMRANLFSGRYGCQTGVLNNASRIPANERTLADCLNDGGYRTSYVGKWHLGGKGNGPIPEELRGGFQEFIGYQCYNGFHDNVCFYDEQGQEHRFQKHRTEVTTDIAIERLERIAREQDDDDRFAMFVSYQAPHYPVQPDPEYAALYEGKALQHRPNSQDIDPYTPTFSPPSPPDDPDYLRYGEDLDEYLRLYYAMVSQIDANVNRLMAKLDELGLAENTVVMFTSDHGDMQGAHGLKNKKLFYEESAHVPMVVRVPDGCRGLRTPALISSTDMYPTILGYAGLPKEPRAEGRNYAPLTLGQPQEINEAVFSEDNSGWFMIRKGDLKLVADHESYTPLHLFDLANDPYEMNDLINDPARTSQIDDLRVHLEQWHQDVMSRA